VYVAIIHTQSGPRHSVCAITSSSIMESTLNETLVMFVHIVSRFLGGEIVLLGCDACHL